MAVGQAFMVEAEEMQDRRLQIMDVDRVLVDMEAEIIGARRRSCRGLMPPPASHIEKAVGWWSRPRLRPRAALDSTIGVRPNSPPQITRVSSSRPRCLRSMISAAEAWSVFSAVVLVVAADVRMRVPALVVDVHEAHAALDHAAGQQAGAGE